jgi:hypothetical protein
LFTNLESLLTLSFLQLPQPVKSWPVDVRVQNMGFEVHAVDVGGNQQFTFT